VADCIALFCLNQTDSIPVDTHVFDIAVRDYFPHDIATSKITAAATITPTLYNLIGDVFRTRFGQYAGWAHSLLFCAELSDYKHHLPEHLVAEMDEFNASKKAQRKSAANSYSKPRKLTILPQAAKGVAKIDVKTGQKKEFSGDKRKTGSASSGDAPDPAKKNRKKSISKEEMLPASESTVVDDLSAAPVRRSKRTRQ
jgi:hypothetical protein